MNKRTTHNTNNNNKSYIVSIFSQPTWVERTRPSIDWISIEFEQYLAAATAETVFLILIEQNNLKTNTRRKEKKKKMKKKWLTIWTKKKRVLLLLVRSLNDTKQCTIIFSKYYVQFLHSNLVRWAWFWFFSVFFFLVKSIRAGATAPNAHTTIKCKSNKSTFDNRPSMRSKIYY